ncbi:polysaccharide lyase [Flaviaesturariibacter amylovorans]|uniref:Polysaccharide lyase 14 domain-containing protein n=1 Tax=Flaviaesturariibacter amylovorans TaxID=1084520 RepID=A0ABP8HE08_9BACT
MYRNTNRLITALTLLLLYTACITGCSKNEALPATDTESALVDIPQTPQGSLALLTEPTAARAAGTTYSVSVVYSGRPNGPYEFTEAARDYVFLKFWKGSGSRISGGMLRTTLLRNILGPDGGTVAEVDVPDAVAYRLSYNLMFASSFDFSAGGKVGFGLLIGAGHSGGVPSWDGNGGSVRLMWYKGTDGRVCLRPYVYYKDQPGIYGHDFGKTFPATGSLIRGKWYPVKIFVKSNKGLVADGRISITIAGVVVLDRAIRWTTNDLQRQIKKVVFETFRGGIEPYWQSATDGSIYFNNVTWSAM